MKKKEKVLARLLSAALICGLLTGCASGQQKEGGNEGNQESSGQESTLEDKKGEEQESVETPSDGNVLEVEIWSSDASKEAVLTQLINDYNGTTGQENGISLKLTISSELQTLLKLAQENKELPYITDDMISTTYEEGGYMLPFYMLPGGQEFLDEWERKTSEYGPWNMVMLESKDVYRLSYSYAGSAVYYNKDMFKAAGIVDENGEAKAPASWAELLEDCKILTNGTTYGLALPLQWGSAAKMSVIDNSHNSLADSPLVVDWDNLTVDFTATESFETIAEIYKNGYCVPGAETIDNDPARSFFSEGVAGIFLGYYWDIGVFTEQYVADFDWDLCQLAADDGTEYGTSPSLSGFFGPTSAVAELDEDDQKKVMSVLEWLYGDEVGAALVEAGLIFPVNAEFLEKADQSLLQEQTLHLMEQFAKGNADAKYVTLESKLLYGVDYDGQGTALLNDTLISLCKGEITIEEADQSLDEAFTNSLMNRIEANSIIPEYFQ